MGRRIYNKLCANDFCGRPFWTLDPDQKCCCTECQKVYEEFCAKPGEFNRVEHFEGQPRVSWKIDHTLSDNMQELNRIALECRKQSIQYGEYMRRLYAEYGKYI